MSNAIIYMQSMRIRQVIALCSAVLLVFTSCRERSKYIGKDPRNFKETIAWRLAKLVMSEDENAIKYEILDKRVPIDFQEPHYGLTALQLAVLNNKKESVRILLELGADPNLISDSINSDGGNAIIYAAKYQSIDSKILKLLLEHGGDPNSTNRGVTTIGTNKHYPLRMSALSYACERAIGKVRMLVDYGANVNYKCNEDSSLCTYPIENAIILGKMDIVLFLLEHGAKFDIDFGTGIEHERIGRVDILYRLRQCMFEIGSDEYKTKMKIVEFLRCRGLDYFKSEVPEYIVKSIKQKYPKTWEEYIAIY